MLLHGPAEPSLEPACAAYLQRSPRSVQVLEKLQSCACGFLGLSQHWEGSNLCVMQW